MPEAADMRKESIMSHTMKTQTPFDYTKFQDCYQCGKCTAGCPMAEVMDISPNQLVRLVQMGELGRATACGAIWQCVACQTCTNRCPQSVDIAGVLDVLREISAREGAVAPELQRTVAFQKAFLDNIRRNGRLNELELVGQFKAMAFVGDRNVPMLFKDALLGPKMLAKGKLHLLSKKAKDRAVVRRIFDRCMKSAEKH
jgi:heterodisulfide reductase subunit C